MRALCDGRENNPTHKETFNTFVSELKKKNPKWERTALDCERSTAKTLFTEENSDGYNVCIDL